MTKKIILGAVILMGFFLNGCDTSDKVSYLSKNDKNLSFVEVSNELDSVMDLFKGDQNTTISFDKFEAKSRNISNDTIKIAIGLVNISNELISQKSSIIQNDIKKSLKINKSSYVDNNLLNWFFNESKKIKEVSYKNNNSSSIKRLNKISINFDATRICGAFWNPVPNIGGKWRDLYKSKKSSDINKFEKKLFAKGYHSTSSIYGGGYTKPVNYNSWICGNGSFRHHAYIYYNKKTKEFITREQSYSESYVGGEPNPEIFTYSWPYAIWPAYVKWWHDFH